MRRLDQCVFKSRGYYLKMSSRMSIREAKSELFLLAMDAVATDALLRSKFVAMLDFSEEFFTKTPSMKHARDIGVIRHTRRWRAFCAVAPALHARGVEAWTKFLEIHLAKIENDAEASILVHFWVKTVDAAEVMERVMAKAAAGKLSEHEAVRYGDLLKVLHSVQETATQESREILAAFPEIHEFAGAVTARRHAQ